MTGGDQRATGGNAGAALLAPPATATTTRPPSPSVTLYRGTASAGGVNLFV